ncbi:hypothetical protein GLOIN_2v30972 [Rhizophagus irregularis DAOM 181602=DAOM 197198]|uniref:Uncharacterized protein n=1 Tax=Rhizophagus irregularis (strain DAOM 181602 / DAOM 197198 / MUCL 43194) TaxID=747089 RepID=A0A2P4NK25_RHIID|nr:hypothetical protein GLOIN_2v30972 [Rhizophagus irregularis DAOM 181602=DAOM 197198]POG53481.1 hypothetical protein GLOIN_2v30972 [Rhizophagus irregularis DAOM 181602=DAOM 197198]|eukprot:XP_025164088.1 hypothetical protein GLOIN_2v30972 [Rhizophagus irregularis DAOM 181602=DAOM 197198]
MATKFFNKKLKLFYELTIIRNFCRDLLLLLKQAFLILFIYLINFFKNNNKLIRNRKIIRNYM